jgi:FkbM family methyltransferase
MMPETAATLRHHVALNHLGNVTVVENALSDRVGDTLVARQPIGSAGQASVAAAQAQGIDYIERHVMTTTLDEVSSGMPEITLMKADLEGHEEAAFRGGVTMLRRATAVIFESWPEDAGAARAEALLRDLGYNTDQRYSYNVLAVRENSEAIHP